MPVTIIFGIVGITLVDDSIFSTGPAPHVVQVSTAGSAILWKTSNVCPFGQRYS